MSVLRLMNSAMMPAEGTYRAKRISKDEFVAILRQHKDALVSYIGYPETARYIERISGVPVAVSREATELEDGDVMLVCKLSYRPQDPKMKGKLELSDETVEFWMIDFSKEK